MDVIIGPLFSVLLAILEIYTYVVIAQVILSWLISFNVVNTGNRLVYLIADLTYRLTEPLLKPIRRFLPDLGGIDISPVVLLLAIFFLNGMLVRLASKML